MLLLLKIASVLQY